VSKTEVVIIGAGPFGLSISAHLSALGVDHLTVGRPMDTWRTYMPDGMLMKSEPYASTIASPGGKYDVAAYCGAHGLDYVDRVGPLTRERFLEYADWYAKQLVPGCCLTSTCLLNWRGCPPNSSRIPPSTTTLTSSRDAG
jgi:FAD-dependent urate hydroxylase